LTKSTTELQRLREIDEKLKATQAAHCVPCAPPPPPQPCPPVKAKPKPRPVYHPPVSQPVPPALPPAPPKAPVVQQIIINPPFVSSSDNGLLGPVYLFGGVGYSGGSSSASSSAVVFAGGSSSTPAPAEQPKIVVAPHIQVGGPNIFVDASGAAAGAAQGTADGVANGVAKGVADGVAKYAGSGTQIGVFAAGVANPVAVVAPITNANPITISKPFTPVFAANNSGNVTFQRPAASLRIAPSAPRR
jgi:hypothetical protein